MYTSFKYLLTLSTAMIVCVRSDDFIYDYFVYKNVRGMTVFSCEDPESDYAITRKMNELNIFVGVTHPQSFSYDIIHQVKRKGNWAVGLLLDTRCQTSETTGKIITQRAQATENHLYEGIHVWLMIASNFDDVMSLLNDASYSPMTDLVIAIEIDIGYELYDVYNPSKSSGGILNVTKLGTWDTGNGLIITLTQEKFYRRSNLHGMKIRVGWVVKYRPVGIAIEDHLQDYRKKNEDPVSKYGYAVVQLLADLYNFTMEPHLWDEWAATINGTERGMMVELSKAKIDIGGSPCSANSRYAPYGHISAPGYPYRTFFLLRSNVEKLKWTELLTPLAIDSWYATFVASLLSVIIISTIQMTEYREGWLVECGHATFATIGVLCQQGLVFVPNRLAGRVALFFLLIFGVLLFNYYGASVVSARLSEPPDKMNDSLYSLAKSQMKVASEPFFVVDDNLNSRSLVDWEVRYFNEKVWKKLGSSRYEKLEKGLSKVAQGGYAYHTSAEVAYPYVDTHWDDEAICDMTEIHVITPRFLSFWDRIDSPFTEMIKIGFIKALNMGLQKRNIKRWKPKIPYCSSTARSLQSISLFDIAPAIMFLIIGTTVALTIFVFEIKLYKKHTTRSAGPEISKIERTGGKKTLLRS
ncbi:ionotropic receptor 75a-like [Venturia canescens]|uniref:ionotropic receptor 75a-like n=1 Tax=Venturia canescens TaxID=32260 RepID=UPI001C9C9901|nr:ionotropic receptor 75a-like [Venturia canescens]